VERCEVALLQLRRRDDEGVRDNSSVCAPAPTREGRAGVLSQSVGRRFSALDGLEIDNASISFSRVTL
jgi:hypothetical protein